LGAILVVAGARREDVPVSALRRATVHLGSTETYYGRRCRSSSRLFLRKLLQSALMLSDQPLHAFVIVGQGRGQQNDPRDTVLGVALSGGLS
jgi:hypothetical protein